ncbi:hypothetical protein [Nocardioides pinisoli]|uniref:ARB-07466-like C-terminal domain-containing protein n=1 Tax=Nocardioides pinisoli TaxID=2950279 RepID=A0ABT1L2T2_9ACTN|nr:hypothetical protein [Nocardioides pinisoli]MCP3424336.1 hypothetical protein [Nocardioides pinisoli]
MATLSAVTMGVLAAEPATDVNLLASSGTSEPVAAGTSADSTVEDSSLRRRAVTTTVSRSQIRGAARAEAAARKDISVDKKARQLAKKLDDTVWTTDVLNLWDGPSEKADKLGVIDALKKVPVTGREQLGRTQVVIDGQSRWVTSDYLSATKPKPEPEPKPEVQAKPAGPSLGGSCANGSSIDAGRASLYEIHDVVCANWPSITSYGTWRGDGEHGQGRAIDIMVSGDTGWAVADFLRANYAALGIEYIIYAQNIWSVERSGEGWRGMSDRGSVTANHYDHVHVTVY